MLMLWPAGVESGGALLWGASLWSHSRSPHPSHHKRFTTRATVELDLGNVLMLLKLILSLPRISFAPKSHELFSAGIVSSASLIIPTSSL